MKLKSLTERIIDNTLVLSVFLGISLYIIGLFDYPNTGFRLSFVTDFITILIISVLTIKRKSIGVKTKSLIIQLVLFLLFIFDTIEVGALGKDKLFMILIPFYAFLVYPLRKVIYIYALAVIIFSTIGFLHITGHIHPNIDLNTQNLTINTWVSNITAITIIVFIVMIIMFRYREEYALIINKLEKKNKEISEQELYFQEIFNSTSNAIFIYSLDGKLLDVNETMVKMYGYKSQEEVLKTDVRKFSVEKFENLEDIRQKHFQEIREKGSISFDWKARKKDGSPFWINVEAKQIKINNKVRILSVVKDITQQKEDTIQLKLYRNHLKELVAEKTKQLEQANEELKITNENIQYQKEEVLAAFEELKNMQQHIIQTEKLASLGLLAAGIAHEINNPLNFIQGGVYAIENYLQQNIDNKHYKEIEPLLSGIKEGVRRASNIVTGLNQYSRIDEQKKEECDIHKIIENSLVMLNHQLKNKITIRKNYTSKKYKLIGNEGKLHQVFMNIIQNAIHAVEDKGEGEINIRTQTVENEKKLIIKISDTGKGISQQNMEKIFDPFFTTKDVGKGTGLGMSISLQIVNEHKGEIKYNSIENKGTEVIISLPIEV
ncbi:MAG: ATP-binding protein [Bacteroidales bacterium]|nr:ATP-binding protein [Bacteroidales bacterium]